MWPELNGDQVWIVLNVWQGDFFDLEESPGVGPEFVALREDGLYLYGGGWESGLKSGKERIATAEVSTIFSQVNELIDGSAVFVPSSDFSSPFDGFCSLSILGKRGKRTVLFRGALGQTEYADEVVVDLVSNLRELAGE